MTVIDGYHIWNKPVLRAPGLLRRNYYEGRGRILVTVFIACAAFWALLGFAISQI